MSAPMTDERSEEGVGVPRLVLPCDRVEGLPTVKCKITPEYSNSESQIYVHGVGTLGRTGICVQCDAAIYRREAPGGTFPGNLAGASYHAVEGGLVCLPDPPCSAFVIDPRYPLVK